MRKSLLAIAACCLLMTGLAATVKAGTAERYLHVRVEDPAKGESVNVNVPLSMAEKILPTINKGELHDGRITISEANMNGIDVRPLLDAIRTAPDHEFVTVKQRDQNVRVAKSNGNLVVQIRDTEKGGEKVDVTVPMKVVDALFSTAKQNELDVTAALRALSEAGDTLLVTVHDATQQVRIWVDSRSAGE
jgi:hypothetical protein